MEPNKSSQSPIVTLAYIIGICLVIASGIVAVTVYSIRSDENLLTVTGSAKTTVVADKVKWVTAFTRITRQNDLKSGYDAMAKDLVLIKKFYVDQGIAEKDVIVSQVFMNEDYSQQNVSSRDRDYILRQTVEVNSSDVEKIQNLSKNISPIVNQGILFSTQSLEFFYSKLPELRVSLLSDAVKDAKLRAEKLAESTGKQVGTLKSASSGVVQVLSANSVEISDYGSYDTSSVTKDIMVTVKAVFILK